MSGSNQLPAISLDELERLIRLLGMLGSSADGEALNAARLAVRWVAEKGTDWRTLLTPDPEAGVTSVVAAEDPEAIETARIRDRAQAYDLGYQDGMKTGLAKAMAQVKAQAQMATNHPWNGPQSPVSGFGVAGGGSVSQTAQGPVRASGASGGGAGPVYPAGSWQAVCQELLDRDDAGVPGVLRSRERTFVADVLARGFPTLTAAQEHWLRDIAGRNHMTW